MMWLRQETYGSIEGARAMLSSAAGDLLGSFEPIAGVAVVPQTIREAQTQPQPQPQAVDSSEATWVILHLRLTIWTLTSVAGAFIAMRMWAKHRRGRSYQLDDNLLILSWILLVMASVLIHMCTYIGLGRHQSTLDEPTQHALAIIMALSGSLFINASSTFGKSSFILSLMRLSSTSGVRRVLWTIMASVLVIMVFHMVVPWLVCRPFWKMLDKSLDGVCYVQEYQQIVFFTGVFLGAADIVLALLPWRIVFLLGLCRADRIGVSLAMSMGVFAGMTAIVKATKTVEVWNGDSTYSTADFVIWGVAECAALIVSASIPAIRPLLFKSHELKPVIETRAISRSYISYPQRPGAVLKRSPGFPAPYDFMTTNSTATIGKALGGGSVDGQSSIVDISDDFKPRPESHYKGIFVELVKRGSVSSHESDSVYEVDVVPCPKARMMRDGLNPI